MIVAALAGGAHAAVNDIADIPAEPAPMPWELRAYWENDGSILKRNHGHDRHYTNGAEAALVFKPGFVDDLAAAAPDAGGFGATATGAGIVFAQVMFTPQDLTLNPPDPTDRPYAGYLYLGGFLERANAHTLDHVQLDVGLVGQDSLAEPAQKWIHDMVDGTDPRGWGSQIKDEPTVQLTLRRKWRVDLIHLVGRALGEHVHDDFEADPEARGGLGVEVIPDVAVGLGTVQRYAEAGAMIRGGWNLPNDFGPGRIGNVGAATDLGEGPGGFSVYGFCRAAGRAVEHDTFIQGSQFRSGPGVDAEPLTGELWGGIALAYTGETWTISFTYSEVFFSKQFETQKQDDSFGAAYLAVQRRF